jgi:hypothetical protein
LTDAQNIHVMLDNHGDMTSSAGCGNGVPMWFSKKIVSNLIGQPLTSKFPFNLLDETNVEKVNGWEVCGSNVTAWSEHAGDPNYNLLNRCCVAMNGGNPGGTGYSELNQKTMNYMLNKGPGRDDFVRFWTLMAKAVAAHPSVSFIVSVSRLKLLKRLKFSHMFQSRYTNTSSTAPSWSILCILLFLPQTSEAFATHEHVVIGGHAVLKVNGIECKTFLFSCPVVS